MYSYDNASDAWPYSPPSGDPRDGRRYRSSTAPARSTTYSPTRPHPPILTPGYVPPTIHKPDLFFTAKAPVSAPDAVGRQRPPYPRHASSDAPQWPYDSYQSAAPPPIPPISPSVHDNPPGFPFPSYPSQSQPNVTDLPTLTDETRQKHFLQTLSAQEETELARALEESLQISSNSYTSGSGIAYNTQPGSSAPIPPASTALGSSMTRNESYHSMQSQLSDDEAFARRLALEYQESDQSHISDDEAFARQLAAQEEDEIRQTEAGPSDTSRLLTADEELARKIAAEEEAEKHRPMDGSALTIINAPPAYIEAVSPNSNIQQSPSMSSADSSLMVDSQLYRSNSAASATSYISSSEIPLPASAQSSRPASVDDASLGSSSTQTSSTLLPAVNEAFEEQTQPAIGGNQFVDQELLRGVSIGFVPPAMTPTLQLMQNVMPNIISLPYGRCPPLHFMAPNWRHLLKLMARLSGTRVEPTVEALAVVKTDLHLRVVIQFVRPHPASMDWRTVIWFTIDHPVPPSIPGARKYISGDVDVLPWSYTLSAMPNVLRESADTPISKTYTIPSTEALPYPKLPITFPNLALYLQAALDESRRYVNDSSTSYRKLSKMMDLCYPSLDRMDVGERSESSGMGGLFRKVIGRGSKNNKSGRRGNEDTYELVTPFVPDEWSQ